VLSSNLNGPSQARYFLVYYVRNKVPSAIRDRAPCMEYFWVLFVGAGRFLLGGRGGCGVGCSGGGVGGGLVFCFWVVVGVGGFFFGVFFW